MSCRLCSTHHVRLTCYYVSGLYVYCCDVPGCGYKRSCKYRPRLKKSQPAARFVSVADKMKMRDKCQVKRVTGTPGGV